MKILDFLKPSDLEVCVALGFFDSIHIGHSAIINRAKEVANTYKVKSAVFTFENDIDSIIKGNKGLVLTYEERLKKLSKLSIDTVISTIFTKEFSNLSAIEFFNLLTKNINVKAIVCGRDYRFGNKGVGDVALLKSLCKEKSITVEIVDDVILDNERVSTTRIKNLLLLGDIKTANVLLGESYSISGEVVHGREVGRQMGFPTANVIIPSEKAKLKLGVYKTHVIIDGKRYNGITNYGARPTFNLDDVLTETYIDGYVGDLYGQSATVYFDDFIRDCVKFDTVDGLICQLKNDLEKIR